MDKKSLSSFLRGIASNYSPDMSVHFARPGSFKVGKVEDNLNLQEMPLGYADPRDIRATSFSFRRGRFNKTSMKADASNVAEAYASMLSNSKKNLVFTYDNEFFERQAYRSFERHNRPSGIPLMDSGFSRRGISSGTAAVVSVKQIVSDIFPSLQSADTTIENVATKLGIKYDLITAANGRKIMNPDQTARVIHRIMNKAWKANPRIVQQSIANAGFRSHLAPPPINPLDPHNIEQYMGRLGQIGESITTRRGGRSIHIRGSEGLGSFIGDVQTSFGRSYANMLEGFAQSVFSHVKDPNEVAFLLTKDKRVLIGLAGSARRYYELPTETAGVIKHHGSFFTSRPILEKSGTGKGVVTSPIEKYFGAFVEGITSFGRGGENIGAALEKGAKTARHSKLAHGFKFGKMLSPLNILGNVSLFPAMFDASTVLASNQSYKLFKNTIYEEGIKPGMNRGNVSGLYDKLMQDVVSELKHMENINLGTGKAGRVDISAYHMMKGKLGKGALPTSDLHGFFWPGTYTKRHMEKGLYQVRGRAEIYDPARIAAIARSRAAYGMGAAQPVATSPMAYKVERLLKFAHSRRTGKVVSPIVEMNTLIGVVGGSASGQRMLFGDSGAFKTAKGSALFRRKEGFSKTSIGASVDEIQDVIYHMAGGKITREWMDVLQSATTGQNVTLPKELKISRVGLRELRRIYGNKFHKGARYLSGIKYDTQTQKYQLGFLSDTVNPVGSSILANDQRLTARFANQGYLKSQFGGLAKVADIITSGETAATMGRENILSRHMLGLVGTEAGQQRGGVARFLKEYQSLGGKGLERIAGTERIRYKSGEFTPDYMERFLKISGIALRRMGFSKGQIHGLAYSSAEYGAGMLAMIGKKSKFWRTGEGIKAGVLPTAQDLKNMNFRSGVYAFLGSATDRAADIADISGQKKVFRSTLSTLHLMSQSVSVRLGLSSPGEHPVLARMASRFTKDTGININLNAKSPHLFASNLPQELKNIFSAITLPGQKPNFAGNEVLTRAQAAEKFIYTKKGISSRMFNKTSSLSMSDLGETNLLDIKRKGFFLDMGDNFRIPISSDKQSERFIMGRHVYIPSGAELRKMTGSGKPGRGSLLHNIVSLLEQPGTAPGSIRKGSVVSPSKAFGGIWRHYIKSTAKGGYFSDKMLTSRAMPGAISGRIIGQTWTRQAANKFTGASRYTAENVFTVRVSEATIQDMARSLAKETGEDIKVVINELHHKALAGKLFGGITPRPQHASSHIPLVNIQIDKQIKKAGVPGRHHVEMHPYLAYFLNRDLDKDTIELFALREIHLKDKASAEKLIKKQADNIRPALRSWVKSMDKAIESDSALEMMIRAGKSISPEDLAKHALPFIGFGQTPALAFIPTYAPISFGAKLADMSMTPETLADYMTKVSGVNLSERFLPSDISKYRETFAKYAGTTTDAAFERALELQRAVYQSAITKGGSKLQYLIEDIMNLPNEIEGAIDQLQIEGAMQRSIDKTRNFLSNLISDDPGALTLEQFHSKIITGFKYEGDIKQVMKQASRELGSFYGIAAVAAAKHYKAGSTMPHEIRDATGTAAGSLSGAWSFFVGGAKAQIDKIAMAEKKLDEQAIKAAAETVEKNEGAFSRWISGSETLSEIGMKVKQHWKLLAGISAGLLVLRKMSGLSSPAPLPKEPMISMPEESAIFPTFNNHAYLMPGQGYSSNMNMSASYSSENNTELLDRHNSFTTVQIRDSRSYKSNFEMQQMQSRMSNSDFYHEYQS